MNTAGHATRSAVTDAADRLDVAAQRRSPAAPVRDLLADSDLDAAYAVQAELTARRIGRGATVTGRKIGLTNPAVQRQLGVDQPDFGVLFDDMALAGGDTVPLGRLLQPKIEAEIAFVLSTDLDGDLDLDRVRRAVKYAVAALEIVDSRVSEWDISIVDTIADNASSGLYVLGPRRLSLEEFVPRNVDMTLRIDGQVVSTGSGDACLDDPLLALLWLARTARDIGDPLRAGQVVLSGALGPMVDIAAGQSIRADISGLGAVAVTIGSGEIA